MVEKNFTAVLVFVGVLIFFGPVSALFASSDDPLPLTAVQETGAEEGATFLAGDITYLKKLADEGNVQAQYHLGILYIKGQEVQKNVFEAIPWLRRAAEQGHLDAQYRLGLLYIHGNSAADARHWINHAAQHGHRAAQAELARMNAEGNGREPNYVEAYKWWLIAARQGDRNAERKRERLESIMTEDQIREAVSLAVTFKPEVP